MNGQNFKRFHRVTALILLTAIVFYLFFQVNKRSPFVDANPFAVDPYDAVGSIAIQLALLISLLSYARIIRLRDDSTQSNERLVLHGNILVLAAIFITLCSDAIAEFLQPVPPSLWRNILILELGGMFLLTLVCVMALWLVFRGGPTASPSPNLTPADAIDDLWSLVRVPVVRGAAILPPPMVEWVKRFNSDRLLTRIHWLNPRQHPWRFTGAVGLLVGILLILVQLQEGPPPSLGIELLLMGIFLSVEFVVTLLGFAIFGGYLGLRPTSMKNSKYR
jgi:hypothetical protein